MTGEKAIFNLLSIIYSMDFKDYQKLSRQTAKYDNAGDNFLYPTLGLVGEAGEVAEKVKRTMRDGYTKATLQPVLKKELGDVLWYVAQVATELDLSLEEIAEFNLEKLFSRKERGKLSGEGDDR